MSPDSGSTALAESKPAHVQLLSLLRDGHALTQAEITERLPITSKRQARRALRKLEEAGISLETGRRGREKEFCLPPEEWQTRLQLDVTEREALGLLLAAWAAESGVGPAPLKDALTEAAQGLADGLPASVESDP